MWCSIRYATRVSESRLDSGATTGHSCRVGSHSNENVSCSDPKGIHYGRGGRRTGEPAYFKHVLNCAKLLLDKAGTKPVDYDYAVFHQPNGKLPVKAGKMPEFFPKGYRVH